MNLKLYGLGISRWAHLLLAFFIFSPNETLTKVHENSLLPVTHGVTVGDVSTTRAVVWSRTSQRGFMHVLIKKGKKIRRAQVFTTKVTGKKRLHGKSSPSKP